MSIQNIMSMNVLITGEKGFIASNLPNFFKDYDANCISLANIPDLNRIATGEVCIHRNSKKVWVDILNNLNIDLVIHNAAVVGTDVVALNQSEATLTNIQGTYNIVSACNDAEVPICYLGTTVIYDTRRYQNSIIYEDSYVHPTTYYGITKKTGEDIVKKYANNWLVMRPLFAYGGIGDMNSLIAKTFYAYKMQRKNIDIFLDPHKIKDYMHVSDFCSAVANVCCKRGILGEDYNVAVEYPVKVSEIVKTMSEVCNFDLESIIKWHPQTDYLGNHVLSSRRLMSLTDWYPMTSLKDGITESWKTINDNLQTDYNPLMYLDEAKKHAIDLTTFYPISK